MNWDMNERPTLETNPTALWQKRDSGGNPAKDLVHPGKESLELLMKSHLRDRDDALAIVGYRDYIREYDIPEEDAVAQDLLASLTSINGEGRYQFLQGITGIMVEGNRGWKIFNWGKRKKEEEERGNS